MSHQAVDWVSRHTSFKRSAHQVLVAIAHKIAPYKDTVKIDMPAIAKVAHVSVRQANRAISFLEKAGALTVRRGGGRYQVNSYSVGHSQLELKMPQNRGNS